MIHTNIIQSISFFIMTSHQRESELNYCITNIVTVCLISRHVQEHMKIPLDTSKMSTDELLFHYFKMMDADMNAKLDGRELVAAVLHYAGFVAFL